jgi:parvulin-like peptidyl-prolyl isomerase
MLRATRLLMALLASVIVTACSSDQNEPGVIATVNGRPIHLNQLEYKYDIMYLDSTDDLNPTVNQLRQDYGTILSDLIIQELIIQELADRGLEVTDEELNKAEDSVRKDYPEGAFEEILVEEYIDISFWRKEFKARISIEKFLQQVLRPSIKIDYTEADSYYRSHLSDFYLPSRLKFLIITGPSRELVLKATQLFSQGEAAADIAAKLKEVELRQLRMREDRLPASWLNALTNLETGEASSVLTEESKFHRLILVERSPAKVLDPTQAYPLVEQVLLDQKMREAFNTWLAHKIEVATITISKHLLEQVEDEQDEQPPQDGGELMGEPLEADAEMPAEAPIMGEEQEYPDQMVPDQIPADEDDDLESIPVPAKSGS